MRQSSSGQLLVDETGVRDGGEVDDGDPVGAPCRITEVRQHRADGLPHLLLGIGVDAELDARARGGAARVGLPTE